MTTIIGSLLIGAAIAEVAKWMWAGGSKVQAVAWSVMALASWVLIMT